MIVASTFFKYSILGTLSVYRLEDEAIPVSVSNSGATPVKEIRMHQRQNIFNIETYETAFKAVHIKEHHLAIRAGWETV